MAKMTLAGIKSAGASYVDASKQAGTWTASTNNVVGLLDKIAKTITVDGDFQDKLPMLNGEDLPLGKTIEEYFVDLTLPEAFDSTGANTLAPHVPSFESVVYNYTLGRKAIPTTVRYDDIERAVGSAEEYGSIAAKIMERLTNSESLWRFQQKKQLLGNVIAKADALLTPRSEVVAIPTDDVSGETFIEKIKKDVEDASFPSEGTSLGGYLIGAAPRLTLFVKKGVMPSIQVQTLAGAIQKEELAMPCDIVVVDDFGNANDKYYALLCDTRGVKLHSGYRAVREQMNAEGDFMNYFLHSENTGYISKSTFVKVYKSSN